jgi:hypothetical protein
MDLKKEWAKAMKEPIDAVAGCFSDQVLDGRPVLVNKSCCSSEDAC